jgi:hypothetical protein
LSQILADQCVFEFVSQMAEFAKTAGRRVAFEGVHGAAQAAQGLEIVRMLFQTQSLLVNRLQDFLSAFEKNLPQFRPAIAGEGVHGCASTRR